MLADHKGPQQPGQLDPTGLLDSGRTYVITTRAQALATQKQATQPTGSTEEVKTNGETKECDAPTIEAEQGEDYLSEDEKEPSDLAQLFPFTGDVIKTPGRSRKKMTRGEKRTHNDRYLRGKKETAAERLIEEQRADPEVQKWN